jgi:hypothetical protein
MEVGGSIAAPFLTSALDGSEWSASRPGRCIPVPIELEAGGGGGSAGLDGIEKRKILPLPGIETRLSSP